MTIDRFIDDTEPTVSPTVHLLDELALYGHRPHDDEPDPRPLPEPTRLHGALADIFDALVATLTDTRLEPDLQALLWSIVNVFHRRIDWIERDLDANETAQRTSQRAQDGSEIRALELERLIAQGLTLIERRNSFEFLRDAATELYGVHTGQVWRPRTGSMVNHATLTAAMIDSREFINARRRADAQVLLPKGTRIGFAGGVDCNDHHRIWAVLDKVHTKHPDMVLLHGGCPRGAEKIAACWANTRKVAQVVFKPEWTRHQKAAPFKRNDQLLETLPIGVIVFPGSGVTDNLADKARHLGIPLFDFRNCGRGA
jgi:YspA, cpYpsA-related SLOG family